MKVLQINCVYKKGSTGKIVNDIHAELMAQNIYSVVCYGRGAKIAEPHVYKFCKEYEANAHALAIRTGLVLDYGGNLLPTRRLIGVIKREEPDVVHVHCINGSCVNIYRLFTFLATNNIKTVMTHHAEFYYTGSCGHAYDCKQFISEDGCKHCAKPFENTRSLTWDNSARAWKSMNKAIHRFAPQNVLFTAVSPWLKERSSLSPIVRGYKCEVVMNGVDTTIFNNMVSEDIISNRVGKHFTSRVLHVCAHFNPLSKEDNKGGWYVVELAKQMPEVLFVVVSLRKTNNAELPDNVFIWGTSKDQLELASLYRSADLTLITSRRETFSMVCAESLCCGTQVAGFKAGGPESIALSEASAFVDYGDLNALKQVVQEMLKKQVETSNIAIAAENIYSRKVMTQNYINLYRQLMQCI